MLAEICRGLVRATTPLLLVASPVACHTSAPADDSAPLSCEGSWKGAGFTPVSDVTFLRGPYLQSVTGDHAVVVWRDTDGAGQQGCVEWSASGGPQQSACAPADAHGQFEVALQGLPRNTMVSYRVSVGADRKTGWLAFRSSPVDPQPVRLLVFGDAHRNESTLGELAAAGLASEVDGVVSVGDQVDAPEEVQFDEYFSGLRPLLHSVPLWPVIGNHEAWGAAYFDAIVTPDNGADPPGLYYSVRVGDVWLASLDPVDLLLSAASGQDLPEATWLREALASPEAQQARWRLLFVHQPPYSIGWDPCDGYHGEPGLRDLLLPLAAEHGVAAIFSGHMHGYEHGQASGVQLFVTGGAGGALDHSCETPEGFPAPWTAEYVHHALWLDARCDALTVEARRLDGSVIETTEILPVAE